MLGREGGYLWIGQSPASRYQGWFSDFGDGRLIKIIEKIEAENGGQAVALENNFWNLKIIRQNLAESFFIFGNNCLAYEVDGTARISIFLDIKESYQNPEFGRYYRVWRENDLILASYRQDAGFPAPEVFLAISGDFGEADLKQDWVRRDYEFDRRRGSVPWDRWVFAPAVLKASKLVFAVGDSREKAIGAAREYWRDFEINKRKLEKEQERQKAGNENEMAKYCARNALKMLFAQKENSIGLRAGLPWFFQFWQRDEAVSLKGLSQFEQRIALEIFWRQMAELKANGFHFETADGIGWLFLRAFDFYRSGKFNTKEIAAIRECLEGSVGYFLKNNTRDGLAINVDGQKTWMDSLNRTGAAIEIQSLRLNMYALAADLADDRKQEEYYLSLEEKLKQDIKKLFFDGKNLCDRFDADKNKLDSTIRPDIFLAAYIYPGLLSKKEWCVCFEAALAKLWLDWGGLATIDRSDSRFCGCDTGENPAAYHNGDSWFWINNIAAIAMAQVDKNRFKNYIDKIFEASKNDILWHGAIGCASEISSAQNYESAGCPNQAWSNATFLELLAEIKI
jgi:glycogen debranching enzyme